LWLDQSPNALLVKVGCRQRGSNFLRVISLRPEFPAVWWKNARQKLPAAISSLMGIGSR
jgi:hypothetical protein